MGDYADVVDEIRLKLAEIHKHADGAPDVQKEIKERLAAASALQDGLRLGEATVDDRIGRGLQELLS